MIEITRNLSLSLAEIEFTFIRSPGPGGQNVNKVASAVQLRFNIPRSSLPEAICTRLLPIAGNYVTQQGDIIIKASRFRTQERNKQDAIDRLTKLIQQAAITPKKRKKTKPTYSSVQQRLAKKKLHSKTKALRRNQGHE